MSQFGDNVTLVNRTSKSLDAQWDGAHHHFDPGETTNVPIQIAIAAVRQNPQHGSEDPLGDPNLFTSLFGIKGAKHGFGDCTPLEQSDAGERIDRKRIEGPARRAAKLNAGAPTHFDARRGVEAVNLQDDAETR